jgi:hypothetical protein
MYDVVVLRFRMHGWVDHQRGVRWAGSAGIGHCDVRHACQTASDDKYTANTQIYAAFIDNGKPRHMRPILSV